MVMSRAPEELTKVAAHLNRLAELTESIERLNQYRVNCIKEIRSLATDEELAKATGTTTMWVRRNFGSRKHALTETNGAGLSET